MLKSFLFTHDDMDGCGCRVVYELAHAYETKGVDYDVINVGIDALANAVFDVLDSGNVCPAQTHIFFADLCGVKEVLTRLNDEGYKVSVFDHHSTNEFATTIFPETAVVMERNALGQAVSGTSLLYKYFSEISYAGNFPGKDYFVDKGNQEIFSLFVDTIRSYDTWEWKQTGNVLAKQLQTLFFMLGIDNFCDKYIDMIKNSDQKVLITDNDMMFVQSKMSIEQSIIDRFTPDDVVDIRLRGEVDGIDHYGCIILGSRGATISELASQFLQKYQQYEFVVGFSLNNPGKEISFRSREESVQCGINFAQPIGGGGHPAAAGAPLPAEAYDDIINTIMKVLTRYYR